MGTISRTGITGGGTIQPTHITNIIDALDGTSTTTTIIATGSFTGSLVGALTGTASFATTALSASYAGNVPVTASYALSALSSSYAVTASYALNAGGGAGVGFPFTGSAAISGSLRISTANNQDALIITGSTFISGSSIGFSGELDLDTNITANKNGIINLAGLGGSGFTGKFVLPNDRPDQAVAGSIYWDDVAGVLYVYSGDTGTWIAI